MRKVRLVVNSVNPRSDFAERNVIFDCIKCVNRDKCRTASCDMVNDIVGALQNTLGKKFDDYVSYGYDIPSKTTTFYAEVGQNLNQTRNVIGIIDNAMRRYAKTHRGRGSR